MKIYFLFFLIVGVFGRHHDHDDDDGDVRDEDRACPSGFTYLGEVEIPHDEEHRAWWEQGDRSPTYSCYKVLEADMYDWTAASAKCFEEDAHLLSVNNYGEDDILTQNKTWELFGAENVLTSGISLRSGSWVWFGSDEEVTVDVDVDESLENTTDTLCIMISRTDDLGNLTYTGVPCADPDHDTTPVCEVRVYTQTWYYWASTNWLSILFLLTLIMLIISSCVTVQMYSTRPRSRAMRQQSGQDTLGATPPPYTVHDTAQTTNKYAEKGKEMLAKIVFVNKAEDKQRLSP